jgi:hypothetical protein
MFLARSLVADAGGPSIMVRGLMLSRWTWSGVSLAVAFGIAIALGISVALSVSIALGVAVTLRVLTRRALRSGLALRSRGAAYS